jgi:hypothetical protein
VTVEVILKEAFPGALSSLLLAPDMPQYTLFIYNKQRRIKYPRNFDLPDANAVRKVALRLVRVFSEVVPYWNELSYEQQGNFVVEVADEKGRTVLTVPFRDADEAEG